MADLITTLLKVAFLAVLWIFVLLVANVIRTDLFRTAPAAPRGARPGAKGPDAAAPVKRSRKEPKVLAIDSGSQAGTRLALVDEFRIGRSAGCALVLDDDYVSGDHASLVRTPRGEWVLSDLGSTNGTFVNEVRVVTPTVVTPSDSLRIGRTQMRLET
jgi:pSer/pThr/pTyr-binding forkhead associated (FHA) protein